MNNDALLRTTSLLAVLLATLHVADDVVRGFEPPGLGNLSGIGLFTLWAYAALVLVGKRSGYVLLMLGSLLAMVMPLAHFRGRGVIRIIETDGALLFTWTLLLLGVLGSISLLLAGHGLWVARSGRDR